MRPMSRLLCLFALAVLAAGSTALLAQQIENDEESSDVTERSSANPVFYVLIHSPGPQWQEGVPFREQPGVGEHVGYMRGLLDQGLILMGGPFLDDSGGMMVARTTDPDEARRIAHDDPSVKNGLLLVTVRPWMVPMSALDLQ